MRTVCSLPSVRDSAMRAKAREAFDECIAMWKGLAPNGNAALAETLYRSGIARQETGDEVGAGKDLAEAVAVGEKVLPAGHKDLEKYRDAAREAGTKPDAETDK